jgi:hypothetical protein
MGVRSSSTGNRLSKHMPPNVAVSPSPESVPFVSQNVDLVLQSLQRKWDVEVSRLQRYLLRNYNIANGIEDETIDDSASDGRPATAASLGTMLENLKFEVAVSADEIHASPPDTTSSPQLSRTTTRDSQPVQIYIEPKTSRKPSASNLRPQTSRASQILPPEYGSSSPSAARLALPVPAVPAAVTKANSVRSARSSSTVSTGTGSGRSTYGMASSTLRGFLTGSALKDKRRVDAMRPVCVSTNDKPPQLDWAPPKLDLQELQ